jgi:hypothetical protein
MNVRLVESTNAPESCLQTGRPGLFNESGPSLAKRLDRDER